MTFITPFLKSLILSFALEGGMIPGHEIALVNNFSLIEKSTLNIKRSFYSDMKFAIDFGKYFYADGGITSYQWVHKGGTDFFPFRMDYQVGAGVKYKSLQIGYAHDCFHPVMPYMVIPAYEKLDVSYHRIFARIEIRKALFQ